MYFLFWELEHFKVKVIYQVSSQEQFRYKKIYFFPYFHKLLTCTMKYMRTKIEYSIIILKHDSKILYRKFLKNINILLYL